jgi:myosin-5
VISPLPFAYAFAKEIYPKTVLWLVRCINDAICAEMNYSSGTSIDYGWIGLFDIPGFESRPVHGFEQLCINYCHEKLQQKFTSDLFRNLEEEYKAQGLELEFGIHHHAGA